MLRWVCCVPFDWIYYVLNVLLLRLKRYQHSSPKISIINSSILISLMVFLLPTYLEKQSVVLLSTRKVFWMIRSLSMVVGNLLIGQLLLGIREVSILSGSSSGSNFYSSASAHVLSRHNFNSQAILSRKAYPLTPDENLPDESERYEHRGRGIYYGSELNLSRFVLVSNHSYTFVLTRYLF